MREALLPRAALPYLDVAVPAHTHHAELAPLRREALDVLAAGYRSTGRTLLGVLGWALTAAGATTLAVLPWQGPATTTTAVLAVAGTLVLAAGLWLAAGVLRAGRRLTGAAAAWLRVPAAGASDTDSGGLLKVLRWRAVLAAVAAAVAVALTVTLAWALTRTGALGAAYLSTGGAPAVPDATRAVVVAALAVGALTAAGAAVSTFGGVRVVLEAAWTRPTVASEPAPRHPAVLAPPFLGPPTVEPPFLGPPTVELDLSSVRTALAGQEGAAPAGAGEPRVEVVLPDGRRLGPGTTLVGRRPEVRPEDLVDDVVVLTDQTVTKTHAAITVEGAQVRVVDRRSTNGTLLEAPDGSLVRCRPWQVTTVRTPAIIHLGRTRLHVRAGAARRPLEVA
ncbi:FHA domain-containing protein [Georgenia satyanarayanai]|uniref:FHA domain-containing protein n=1 Tax=Georgenia satyanarayanai TaxID=860221 RepID=A0A2Y9C2P5_9MICO|nr:FHA domain-containing protein [Georgenia satyanarayanai]PYG01643.1 FHA domain-containing protein [Georgenia satyanarayanai]SSA36443.1 FHA domain-containing protein [Georgenia satyanarayanai]